MSNAIEPTYRLALKAGVHREQIETLNLGQEGRKKGKMSAPTPNTGDSDTMPDVTYGFVGLGNMGSGMAKNLRARMPKQSTLIVCELDEKKRQDFVASTEGFIETADTPRELAEKSVCNQAEFTEPTTASGLMISCTGYHCDKLTTRNSCEACFHRSIHRALISHRSSNATKILSRDFHH